MKKHTITPWAFAVAALLLLMICFMVFFRMICDDHWWHLATGRLIVAKGTIPHTDPFSFTFAGKPWVNWEWLAGVVMWLAWSAAGPLGMVALRFLAVTCSLVCIWRTTTSRKNGSPDILGYAVVLTATLLIIQFRLADRPHTYAFAFLAVSALLTRLIREKPRYYYVAAFFILIALWVNLHPSWMVGVAWFWAAVIDELRKGGQGSERTFRQSLAGNRRLLLAAVILPFAAFLTPNVLSYGEAVRSILTEQTSPEWFSVLYWGARAPVTMVALTVLVTGWVAYAVTTPRRGHLAETLLLAALFIQGMRHIRFIVPFAILAAPLSVAGYRKLLQGAAVKISPRTLGLLSIGIVVLGLTAVGFNLNHYRYLPGYGIDERYNPVKLIAFMKKNRLYGKTLASNLQTHGVFSFFLWPDVTTYIDGRTPQVFPTAFRNAFSSELTLEGFRELLRTYRVQNVVISRDNHLGLRDELMRVMVKEPDFGLAYFDDDSLLFRRKDNETGGTWQPFTVLRPWDASPAWMEKALSGYGFDRVLCEISNLLYTAPDQKIDRTFVGLLLHHPGLSPEQINRVLRSVKTPEAHVCDAL